MPQFTRRHDGGTCPTRRGLVIFVALGLALSICLSTPMLRSHALSMLGQASALSAQRSAQSASSVQRLPGLPQSGEPPRPVRRPRTTSRLRPANPEANGWTNVFPSLYAISAISSTEAWASGEYGHLLHYTAGTWTTVDPPVLRGNELYDIKMLSAGSGWIAAGWSAFQYDGNSWTDKSSGLSTVGFLSRLAPLAADDVWGVGSNALLHWDGTQWRAAAMLSSTVSLSDIVMSSPGDGWAAGEDDGLSGPQALLLHYDGTAWTRVPAPADVDFFESLAVAGPGEIWLTGELFHSTIDLLRYRAGSWNSWESPDVSGVQALYMFSPSAGWASTGWGGILRWDGNNWTVEYSAHSPGNAARGLSGVPGQVWAAGGLDTIMSLSAGKPWVQQHGGPAGQELIGVSAVSTEEAWAVGDQGTILHYTSGVWSHVSTSITATLEAVQMLSPTDGYAVGAVPGASSFSGLIARWDGLSWHQVMTTPTALNSLYMFPGGAGWAVGENALWHAVRGVWSAVPLPVANSGLSGVAMDSPTHGWAIGNGPSGPLLLEYAGTTWVDRSTSLPAGAPVPYSIALAPGGADGWVVGIASQSGSGHVILRLTGGRWSLAPVTSSSYFNGVASEALGEVWTVGCVGAYHYVGATWQAVDLPASGPCLSAISLIPGRGGWAVGGGGSIFRYNPLVSGQRFYDVPPGQPFYSYIDYLAARDIVGGYADNTFRPYTNTTRSQMVKIVALGFNKAIETPTGPAYTFTDVTRANPFFNVVETAYADGIVSGYTCGVAPAGPCDAQRRPYFLPYADVTRGQLSKIDVISAGWAQFNPPVPHFTDVPHGSVFYTVIEAAYCHGAISGYNDGTFRPLNNATRGQIAKIVYLSITNPPVNCGP